MVGGPTLWSHSCAVAMWTQETAGRVRDEQLPPCEAEMATLGTTHERTGAALCAKWMMPASLTRIIS
jgi:hypothetical protein